MSDDDLQGRVTEFSTELIRAANEVDKLSMDELRRLLERARATVEDLLQLIEEDTFPAIELEVDPAKALLGASAAIQQLRRRLAERKAS
ncbi:hypothetical protein ACSBOB_26940 [Mesorhizobium sp. ASY16-5R]|uniref:hypothetical protein n=1 Tax=Mesorhizobium sp. ASY16-5R TaxID=3445772 RepID=UPI003F9FAF51